MPLRTLSLVTLLLLTGLLALPAARAQEADTAAVDTSRVVPAPEPRSSPMATAATKLSDGTYVKVVYGSPRMRGREIFGALVPYGEVWRTGANEATEITFTEEVTFGGQSVPAGTYALFTVPGPDAWTVILNRELGQWGAYNYTAEADVLRLDAPAEEADKQHEAFTIAFDEADDAGTTLSLTWDETAVRVPLEPAGSRMGG